MRPKNDWRVLAKPWLKMLKEKISKLPKGENPIQYTRRYGSKQDSLNETPTASLTLI